MNKWRSKQTTQPGSGLQTFKRVGKYSLARGASILAALLIGVYLCVLAVNFGGFIDEIFNDIVETTVMNTALFGDRSGESYEETNERLNNLREQLREYYGLNEPFFNRSLRWYWRAITFDWGEEMAPDDSGYFLFGEVVPIRQMILAYLPRSLLLFAAANLTTFIIGIFTALIVARKPGNWVNSLISILSPLFTAPSWVYGIILIMLIPAVMTSYPRNMLVDPNFDYSFLEKTTIVLKRLVWPVAATFLSMFVQLIFTWRTFFLLSSNEDHVTFATAMGLPSRRLERDHILRPTLLPVITNFSMLLLSFWQSSLALELLFNWPGIGLLFIAAFRFLHRNIIIGIVVTFAFLIAITVFILEFFYALVDPRVRLTGSSVRQTSRRNIGGIIKGWFSAAKEQVPRRAFLKQQPTPFSNKGAKPSRPDRTKSRGLRQAALVRGLRQLVRSPLAASSLLIVTGLIVIAVVVVIKIPTDEAIVRWRVQQEDTWRTPELAAPVWTNLFRTDKLPQTLFLTDEDPSVTRDAVLQSEDSSEISFTFPFDFQAASLPEDLKIKIEADYDAKRPFITIVLHTPDGRELELAGFSAASETLYSVGDRIEAGASSSSRSYAGRPLTEVFSNPSGSVEDLITGEYSLQITAITFEENSDVHVEFALLGGVYGLAGTDYDKRDLAIPLLWGLPIALVFGLAGAVLTSLTTMLIAALGAWFGGWVDTLIQRITEINIMIPALPIAMTIYFSVSKSIWAILGVIVLLNIFSSEVKNYRSAFLQIKDMPYVEAARSYGATNFHIIRSYLIPKIYPLLVPRLVFMVPAYVYLEATLAYLGVSGIFIPTWGKVIFEGLAHREAWYWITQPIILLVFTGAAFTMLGIALDKILNPTLQEIK